MILKFEHEEVVIAPSRTVGFDLDGADLDGLAAG